MIVQDIPDFDIEKMVNGEEDYFEDIDRKFKIKPRDLNS